jgi:hypothetical protein
LIEIPELAVLTNGKRAGYLLGMAYLASQRLGIPIQSKTYETMVLVNADGLFVANIFKNGSHPAIGFQTPLGRGDFKRAAIMVLENAAANECRFSSGWYRNDAREIDFLTRTCGDLQQQTREAVELIQARAQRIEEARRQLEAEEAARAQKIEEERRQLEAEKAERAQRIVEEKRRIEAEEAARKKQARDALRDRFEASARGRILYSVIRASLMQRFLQTHPSPLPSERAAGERAVNTRAKCIVRYVTPEDPDKMSADEKAAIDMIITDLPLHGAIRNQAVALTYALMNTQCMEDGQ